METFQKSSFMPWHTKQGWTSTMCTNSLSSLHLHREITNKQRRNSRITNSWIFAVQKDLNATQTFWHFPLNLRCGLGISETPGLEDTPIYRRILFPARAKCQQGQGSLPSSHTNRLQKVVGFFFFHAMNLCCWFVLLILPFAQPCFASAAHTCCKGQPCIINWVCVMKYFRRWD